MLFRWWIYQFIHNFNAHFSFIIIMQTVVLISNFLTFTKSPKIDVQLLVKMPQTQGRTQTIEGLKLIRGSWLVNLAALHRPLYKVSFFEGGLKGALAFWLKPPAPSCYIITFLRFCPWLTDQDQLLLDHMLQDYIRTIWFWTINNLEEYFKSNMLQDHIWSAYCSRSSMHSNNAPGAYMT